MAGRSRRNRPGSYPGRVRFNRAAFAQLCRDHKLTHCQQLALAMIATKPAARPERAGVHRYLVSIAYELRRTRRHTQRVLSQLVAAGLLTRQHGQRLPSATTETGWSTDGPTAYRLTGGPAGLLWHELTANPPAFREDEMPRRNRRPGPQERPAQDVIRELRGDRPPERVYWTPDNPIFHTYMYCTRHDLLYRDCRECRRIALRIMYPGRYQ